ncbi:MAG: tRNA threonylcarbamoyladenosine biosynthesis protein TsaE [Patescibacteria group bacterium]|nr:tRNA threonylcarbamoyladenosine biosynthesis protein TsaE [Patescibacteria group bacterium]
MTTKYIAHSLTETQKIAGHFVSTLNTISSGATVVGLYGDLGAGKTSFTQGVAQALGIQENVVSPTFVIEKIYELGAEGQPFSHLIHIDAYRIETSSELLHLGWNEIISNPTNLILIEWPERVADIMPPHIKIQFTHMQDEGREIEIMV